MGDRIANCNELWICEIETRRWENAIPGDNRKCLEKRGTEESQQDPEGENAKGEIAIRPIHA